MRPILLVALFLVNLGLVGCALAPRAAQPVAAPNPCTGSALQPPPTSSAGRWEVTFCNGDLVLHGWLYKPQGDGPFPTVLYNHGSEKDPRGYLGDQLAGFALLQTVAFVNPQRVVVTGASYGGIQTILGAEANPGYRAAVDCAGAAQTWQFSPPLRDRLTSAIATIAIPVFLFQAVNDYDTSPSRTLAAEFQRLGKPYRMMIYPPFGKGTVGAEGHSFCGAGGAFRWGPDVFDFIRPALL